MVLLDAARAKDYFAARAVKLDITGNIKGIWVQPAWDSGIQPNPAPGRMGRIRLQWESPRNESVSSFSGKVLLDKNGF